jgi:hypothetical protein
MALQLLGKDIGWTPIRAKKAMGQQSQQTMPKRQAVDVSDFAQKRRKNIITPIRYKDIIHAGGKILSKHRGGMKGKRGAFLTYEIIPIEQVVTQQARARGDIEIENDLKGFNLYEELFESGDRNYYFMKLVLGRETLFHAQFWPKRR